VLDVLVEGAEGIAVEHCRGNGGAKIQGVLARLVYLSGKSAGKGVAAAVGDALEVVIKGGVEAEETVGQLAAAFEGGVGLAEAGIIDAAVDGVGVVGRDTIGGFGGPPPFYVAVVEAEGVADEAVVALVFLQPAAVEAAVVVGGMEGEEADDAAEGVRAVEEAGRAFDDLGSFDAVGVYLDAVFVAPLLAFLSYAVVEGQDPVVAESADKGFGDVRAGLYGVESRDVLNEGVNDVGFDGGGELFCRDGGDGDGGLAEEDGAADAGDGNTFQGIYFRGSVLRLNGAGEAEEEYGGHCLSYLACKIQKVRLV